MSMEIYLLTNDTIPSLRAWQDAAVALNFDVHFMGQEKLSAREIKINAECQGKPVLLELQQTTLDYVRDTFPDIGFPDSVSYVQILRWNMTLEGGLAAYEAAAAYIGAVKGLLIDTEEGKLNTPARAIEIARDMSAGLPALKALMADLIAQSINQKKRN